MSITYDMFKFAAAAADSSHLAQSLAFAEGRITVEAEEVEATGKAAADVSIHHSSYRAAEVAALPEGKKFFLAPSLTTASGGTTVARGYSNVRYTAASDTLTTFELRYETPSTLLLRKILERDPDHAAILDSFEETRYRPPPAAEVKQEQRDRVKRERGPPEVIDLSGRPPPPPPAERLAPGEELVCDLTGDGDDEDVAPRWSKRRAAEEPAESLDS